MLRTRLETRHFTLRPGEIDAMRDRLKSLVTVANAFEFAELRLMIWYLLPAEEYHVKGRLHLPGRVLVTGEHDSVVLPPFDRCIGKLTKKTELEWQRRQRPPRPRSAKGSAAPGSREAGRKPTRHAGTQSGAAPPGTQSGAAPSGAGSAFESFVSEFSVHLEEIRDRVRAWVRRHAATEGEFKDERVIGDLVEEVELTAFDRYKTRPLPMNLADWLAILVDPTLRSMLSRPDEPVETVSYGRSLRELQHGWTREPERQKEEPGAHPPGGWSGAPSRGTKTIKHPADDAG